MQSGVICMLVAQGCLCTIRHDDAAESLLLPLHLPEIYDIQQRAEQTTLHASRLYGEPATLKLPIEQNLPRCNSCVHYEHVEAID